ncbi:MAG TPA: hypothetical protein PK096_01935 [Candidatus Saccharibacteria bacterium]|nr:hypothetical protein [Candidatus Saccharibacteria bacterium]HRK94107.1 hypothetical protein [Candidatus Saccharibacteria bacterium]
MDSDKEKPIKHITHKSLEDIPEVGDDLREHIGHSYDARDIIADALYNKTYYEYAVHRGQIEVKDVDPKIRHSTAFQQFIAEYGWPNAKDDNGIEPPNRYDSDDEPDYEAFLDAFLSRSIKDADEGPALDLEANLDNFRMWLIVEPSDQPLNGGSIEQFHATHPALHRLYAIMPELMSAVRTLVRDIYVRNTGQHAANDTSDFADEMSLGVNDELVKAIYLIYQVAGRLLKADDRQRQRKILGLPEQTASKITDAHQELRT